MTEKGKFKEKKPIIMPRGEIGRKEDIAMIMPRGEIGRCLGEDDDLFILLLKRVCYG
ncbi:unnamed protein product [Arabidopsis halleri]